MTISFLSRIGIHTRQLRLIKSIKSTYPKILRWGAHGLPRYCLLCEEALSMEDVASKIGICSACKPFLLRPKQTCLRCGLPLMTRNPYCGACMRTAPSFDNTFAPFFYQTPLDNLIKRFKHQRQLQLGQTLGELFAQELQNHYRQNHLPYPDYIVPVPLHWRRQWQRGFNQSLVLAHIVSQITGVSLFTACKKIVATQAQEQLSKKQRQKNLKGAFQVSSRFCGEHCAIVDDVMTTGATVNALATALKQAGAGTISVWALARTPK